jgi:hypothetical protein
VWSCDRHSIVGQPPYDAIFSRSSVRSPDDISRLRIYTPIWIVEFNFRLEGWFSERAKGFKPSKSSLGKRNSLDVD